MKEYEICAQLTRRSDGAEWQEDWVTEAPSMSEAVKEARRMGLAVAIEHNAKLEDWYALDLETGEQSQ
jgi:hypothetical protein